MSDEGRTLEKRMVVEYGVTLDHVWMPLDMLRRSVRTAPGVPRSPRRTPTRSGYCWRTAWPSGTTRPGCTGASA